MHISLCEPVPLEPSVMTLGYGAPGEVFEFQRLSFQRFSFQDAIATLRAIQRLELLVRQP